MRCEFQLPYEAFDIGNFHLRGFGPQGFVLEFRLVVNISRLYVLANLATTNLAILRAWL